jgi:hypothetical protein
MRGFSTVLAAISLLAAAAGAAQSSGYFWWHAAIDGADTVARATHPTFVLHGRQDALDVNWTFKNDEGAENVQIEPAGFRERIRVTATDTEGRAVDTILAWSVRATVVGPDGNRSTGAFLQQLQPGEWIEWQASLRRADGSAWERGEYRLSIDVAAALKMLRTGAKPFTGRAEPGGIVTVRILPGSSAAAAKARHLREGHKALTERRFPSAIGSYRAAAGLDGSDRAVRGLLGQALVAAGEYKEGAAALELALPLALDGEKSAIPDTLAFAYLAVGDESNARRVLLLTGPPAAVTSRLERLQKQLRGR